MITIVGIAKITYVVNVDYAMTADGISYQRLETQLPFQEKLNG